MLSPDSKSPSGGRATTNDDATIRRRLRIAELVSVVAALAALGSCVYSARTYNTTSRPRLGIVEHDIVLEKGPQNRLRYRFNVKNVGGFPARVTGSRTISSAWQNGQKVSIAGAPLNFPKMASFVLPGQEVQLNGDVYDRHGPAVQAVLDGSVVLEVLLWIEYDGPSNWGWWREQYHYWTVARFDPRFGGAFQIVASDAD